ncbi:unnamed protein product [Linum trigynum]|uniref:Uncharacterized protein n=1 Tax=Linum trigynum TaxID=586398 RepID=A0AAV2EQ12_9ROSI
MRVSSERNGRPCEFPLVRKVRASSSVRGRLESFPSSFCRYPAYGGEAQSAILGKHPRGIEIGNKLIYVNTISGRDGVLVKLSVVERTGKVYHVLFDSSQAEWMISSLQTAELKGWVFPACNVKRSGGRVIHLGRFENRRRSFLKLSESLWARCTFFVIIPSENSHGCWRSLTSVEGNGNVSM